MLIEAKNHTLKCLKLHFLTVRSIKKFVALMEDGALALLFCPHPGDLTVQESQPLAICYPRQEKSPPTWLVSASYSAWHFFMDGIF